MGAGDAIGTRQALSMYTYACMYIYIYIYIYAYHYHMYLLSTFLESVWSSSLAPHVARRRRWARDYPVHLSG